MYNLYLEFYVRHCSRTVSRFTGPLSMDTVIILPLCIVESIRSTTGYLPCMRRSLLGFRTTLINGMRRRGAVICLLLVFLVSVPTECAQCASVCQYLSLPAPGSNFPKSWVAKSDRAVAHVLALGTGQSSSDHCCLLILSTGLLFWK